MISPADARRGVAALWCESCPQFTKQELGDIEREAIGRQGPRK